MFSGEKVRLHRGALDFGLFDRCAGRDFEDAYGPAREGDVEGCAVAGHLGVDGMDEIGMLHGIAGVEIIGRDEMKRGIAGDEAGEIQRDFASGIGGVHQLDDEVTAVGGFGGVDAQAARGRLRLSTGTARNGRGRASSRHN